MAEARLLPIDVNADVGEGLDDALLMPYLTSVSIACGGHAGDEATMVGALRLAASHSLRLGAHPGYPRPRGLRAAPHRDHAHRAGRRHQRPG